MYKTILVPLDGSPLAETILPHVEELAGLCGASVIFLNVIELPHIIDKGATYEGLPQKTAADVETQVAEARRYLDELMALPENQYNPVFLSDLARWYVNHGDYERALARAQTAERYWARLPSELVFAKKAEIYEVQAAAWQGRFYRTPEQLDYLDNAIRTWERYEAHVATKARTDLQTRARNEIARLQSLREKLQ